MDFRRFRTAVRAGAMRGCALGESAQQDGNRNLRCVFARAVSGLGDDAAAFNYRLASPECAAA